MTNLKIKSNEIQTQHSSSTNSGSPFSGDINTFSNQLTSVLSEEKQNEIKEKSVNMQILLTQLKEVVKAKSNEINYDYDKEDYKQRLFQDYEATQKILNEKVLVGDIKKVYDKLVPLLGDGVKLKNNILEKKLFRDILENLVYESMESNFLEKIEFKRITLSGIESAETLENTFKSLSYKKNIDLSKNNLGGLNKYKIESIFKNITNIKNIHLGSNNIGNLDKYRNEVIFKSIANAINVDLSSNNLGNLSKDSIESIFRYLTYVKGIKLYENNLGNLDKNSLDIIFKYLINVKFINLANNDLGNLDKISLNTIFKNFIGVKGINLRNNNLGDLSGDSLNIVFKNLYNVKYIKLWVNNLGNLDNNNLDIIFKHLKNAKYIDLQYNNLSIETGMYISSLVPNAVVNFL